MLADVLSAHIPQNGGLWRFRTEPSFTREATDKAEALRESSRTAMVEQ